MDGIAVFAGLGLVAVAIYLGLLTVAEQLALIRAAIYAPREVRAVIHGERTDGSPS